jgi:hypothetical protein
MSRLKFESEDARWVAQKLYVDLIATHRPSPGQLAIAEPSDPRVAVLMKHLRKVEHWLEQKTDSDMAIFYLELLAEGATLLASEVRGNTNYFRSGTLKAA